MNEKVLFDYIAEFLTTQEGVSEVSRFVNMEMSEVVSYKYRGEKYLILQEEL